MATVRRRSVDWTDSAGRTKTSVRWEATFRDRTGRRHRRLFEFKRDAQQWIAEQDAGVVSGQWVDPKAGRVTVEAYCRQWMAHHVVAPSTERTYESILQNHIYPTIGGMRIDSVTRLDLQKLVKQWQEVASPKTTVQRYRMIAIIMRAAVNDHVIAKSPCVGVRLPRIPSKAALVPVTTETVMAIAKEIAPRYRLFVILGAGTGMRRGELLGLTRDRIDLDAGVIRIDRQLARESRWNDPVWGPPKTDSSTRVVPIAPFVADAIREHEAEFGHHASGLVFSSETGSVLVSSTLHRAWQIAARKVGTDATPHAMRHYFASVQIRAGQSIKVLQAILGHKSATETWDTYGHLMGDEEDRARDVMQFALGGSRSSRKKS
ncbi:MAG: tyrosine-type recombinase/integrase [Nocardioides sp.]